jgi:hypothetical protein
MVPSAIPWSLPSVVVLPSSQELMPVLMVRITDVVHDIPSSPPFPYVVRHLAADLFSTALTAFPEHVDHHTLALEFWLKTASSWQSAQVHLIQWVSLCHLSY